MTALIYKVKNGNRGKREVVFYKNYNYISYVVKTTTMPMTGGKVQTSHAQLTSISPLETNIIININNKWYSPMHHDLGMGVIHRYYLKQESAPTDG